MSPLPIRHAALLWPHTHPTPPQPTPTHPTPPNPTPPPRSITEVDGDGNPTSATNTIPYKNTTALLRDLTPGATYKVGWGLHAHAPPAPGSRLRRPRPVSPRF
jgi:hypothetical protein